MSSLQSRADTAATISGIDRVATLHKIESEPSASPATLLLNHAARSANATSSLSGKRSPSSPKHEEPHKKKPRTTASTCKQSTSYMALPGLAKGIFDGIWAPHVVSPQPDIQDVQVEQVQELAFPSLPHVCSLHRCRTSLQMKKIKICSSPTVGSPPRMMMKLILLKRTIRNHLVLSSCQT